jgi:hypothetical protein
MIVQEQQTTDSATEPTLAEVGRWFLDLWQVSFTTTVTEVYVSRLHVPGVTCWRIDYCALLLRAKSYDHTAFVYLAAGHFELALADEGESIERG